MREKAYDWQPNCDCGSLGAAIKPCTVLDCFAGAGTTGLVADRLQRDSIMIELNGSYVEMATRRLVKDAGMFATIAAPGSGGEGLNKRG